MLPFRTAHLMLFAMLAHALLGCCAHHGHADEAPAAVELAADSDCRGHAHAAEESRAAPSCERHEHPPGHDCPRECERQDCQFVVSNDGDSLNLSAAADSAPTFAAALPALASRADFLLPPRPPLGSLSGCPCALRVQNWVQVWRL
jgi:hypothetical protein